MLQTPDSFVPLIAAQPHADCVTLVFQRERLLLREADLGLPDAAELAACGIDTSTAYPVGMLAGRYYQVCSVAEETLSQPALAYRGLRSLFGVMDEALLGIAARAVQIAEWARTHRFCGACATPTTLAPGERAFACPHCGLTAYPRISPAMMVLIRKGDAVLLALHAKSPSNRYTPLAGFLEAGESIEEAVHREVMEEVGLRVHNLQYFMSQSWPFPHSLMIAFTADYLDGEIRTDQNEIVDARWFGPDDVWPEPIATVSISSLLVNAHRPPGR